MADDEKKVEIVDVGDTRFIMGQHVDKWAFLEENKKVIRKLIAIAFVQNDFTF